MANPSAYELTISEPSSAEPASAENNAGAADAPKHSIVSAANGKVISIEGVPDPVFSSKALGDGVAVIVTDGKVYAPVDGEVSMIADTLHAYGISTPDGLELLVHIGVNTVELKGEGFSPKVKEGDTVRAGQLLCEVDMDLMKSKGYPMYTPILLTNGDECADIQLMPSEKAAAGQTTVITYRK
ncbi:MAG: PTS glucose transporter subunit IIA [Butyricicoccus sp.]